MTAVPFNPARLTDPELEKLASFLEESGQSATAKYADVLQEREKRRQTGLDFIKTKAVVLHAARARRFLSYKEVADASGADWDKIHWQVGRHLLDLCTYSHAKGWPLLSAIVVNKDVLASGELPDRSLGGFVDAARRLGVYDGTEPMEFLKMQQERVFAWAASQQVEMSP